MKTPKQLKASRESFMQTKYQKVKDYFKIGTQAEDLYIDYVNYTYGHERYKRNNLQNVKATDAINVYTGELVEIKHSGWVNNNVFVEPVVYDHSVHTPDILDPQLTEIWYGGETVLFRYQAKPLQEFLRRCIAENKNLESYVYDGIKSGKRVRIPLEELEPFLIQKINFLDIENPTNLEKFLEVTRDEEE